VADRGFANALAGGDVVGEEPILSKSGLLLLFYSMIYALVNFHSHSTGKKEAAC
jgi:hypothetical protein